MNYRGTLIVVKDCRKSLAFYRDLFGLSLVRDNDGNMELSNGIFLQEDTYWKRFLGEEPNERNNRAELYFEEPDPEAFVEKLEALYPETVFVHRILTHAWGQRAVRFYDPDGNLIEVATPMTEESEKRAPFNNRPRRFL